MVWDYCLGNARLLGLHSPQHYPNPIGRYKFGTSRQQFHESNYDDVTYVEYHRVLPVELQSRLHERCAGLLFARGVVRRLACGGQQWYNASCRSDSIYIISAMGITTTNPS
jgi:hypothetical protein